MYPTVWLSRSGVMVRCQTHYDPKIRKSRRVCKRQSCCPMQPMLGRLDLAVSGLSRFPRSDADSFHRLLAPVPLSVTDCACHTALVRNQQFYSNHDLLWILPRQRYQIILDKQMSNLARHYHRLEVQTTFRQPCYEHLHNIIAPHNSHDMTPRIHHYDHYTD